MDAKLIKMMEGYIVSLTGNIDDIYAITNKELAEEHGFYFISLKNCQAIERGYDLGELVMGYDLYENINFVGQTRAYKAGFQKALEILGDKKFSEKDVISMIEKSRETGLTAEYLILNNQQTEWDVIVETTCDGMVTGLCMPEVCDCNIIPKLDADGCLILKRK